MTRYEQGFLAKCAEYGVDGAKLLKAAAEGDGDKLKNVGKAMMLAGASVPAFFLGRGALRVNKALRLIRSGALKTTGEVDRAIAEHLSKVKKTLPKYKWSTLDDIKRAGKIGIGRIESDAEVLARNAENAKKNLDPKYKNGFFNIVFDEHQPLPSSKTIPVYGGDDLLAAVDMHNKEFSAKASPLEKLIMFFQKRNMRGGHFNPDNGYISMGKGNYLNPKMLMHELGHAQDRINGKLIDADRNVTPKSLREWLKLIVDPDSSKLLQTEIRAWDNAGIQAGDKVREAALGTYRNGVQAQLLSPVGGTLIGSGAMVHRAGKRKNRKNG